ncbi:MAG: hypothetical protein DCF15_02205 [Phormidesmis priestleyi]|uniref:Toxin-antitoxin system HicB family antitoxin n=1 Tax=Phormidesmis priestleyi TaxID=268141 RepID=A0A2W4ZQ01_9CYAN|nr:MAG: hypothetical protein DCF15_02205 [Phormidesmis priestleyi]
MSNPQTAETELLPQAESQAEYSGEALINMPKDLHQKLVEAAAQAGIDFNQYIVALLSEQNTLQAIGNVQNTLNEINQQLRPQEGARDNLRESLRETRESSASLRELSYRDQRARERRLAYDNRYVEDWESGLND